MRAVSLGIAVGVALSLGALGLEKALLAVGITAREIDFGAADEGPVRVFFVLVSPSDAPAAHLQALSAISRWLKSPGRADALLMTKDPDEIHDLLIKPES